MILGSKCQQLAERLRLQSQGANPWLQSQNDEEPRVLLNCLIYHCFGPFFLSFISYFPFKTEIRGLKNK